MRIVVLGAGRVGAAIARDLAAETEIDVRLVDRDEARLAWAEAHWGLSGDRADFSLPSTVARSIADADLVVSAVPGFLGQRTLRSVIETGKNVVDIAFFPEDPFSLDDLARSRNVTAIVDCGVAPGLSNLLVGHAVRPLDTVARVAIYVGGLPADPKPPYEYRAVFSPIDVIEEYTRPARLVIEGRITVKPALSDVEPLTIEGVGDLEAFNTDGLRTLMKTISCPEMVEKTLRYPGHADRIRLLRDTGFFSGEPIDIDGTEVRPIDVTTQLLFPLWQIGDDEDDVTVLRVLVEGWRGGKPTRTAYDLVDRRDRRTGVTSMARTTGYTAAMAVRLLAADMVDEKGILAPEMLASDPARVTFMLDGLLKRGIDVRETVSEAESL